MATHTVIISVGSNLGDKQGNCRQGIDNFLASDRTAPVRQSAFYQTSPVDYLDQDWFVNAAIKIETDLDPFELLAMLQAVQQKVGRARSDIRFGPRVLDLDIIFYDQWVIKTSTLEIPHPRMHKRRFVLQPICDIDPNIVHPVLGMTVKSLLNRLGDKEQEVLKI